MDATDGEANTLPENVRKIKRGHGCQRRLHSAWKSAAYLLQAGSRAKGRVLVECERSSERK